MHCPMSTANKSTLGSFLLIFSLDNYELVFSLLLTAPYLKAEEERRGERRGLDFGDVNG